MESVCKELRVLSALTFSREEQSMERLFKERCPDKPSRFKIARSSKCRDFNFGMFCTKFKSFTSFKFRKESCSSCGIPESTPRFSTVESFVPSRSSLLRLLKEERGERSVGLSP